MADNDKSAAYASAELATELRGDNPGEPVKPYAGLIDDPEVIKLLNYYDSLADDPIEETPLGRQIIENASTQTMDEAVRQGNVSKMNAGTGLTRDSRSGDALLTDAARKLTHEGAIGLVLGSPGSGKTATTIDVARTWQMMTDGAVIGNTNWDGFDRVVESDQEMLEAMGEIKGPVLAVIDEIAQELSGFGSGNKQAETFSDRLLFIRKREERHGPYPKKGCVLAVGHTRNKTAKSIRRVASFGIEKPTQEDPSRATLLESEGGKDTWTEAGRYSGIEDTAADYDEHEPSEFEIVMDGDGDGPQDDPDEIRRRTHIETAIRRARDGDAYPDIASALPFGKDWVGKVYREWRDEDRHTELVPKE